MVIEIFSDSDIGNLYNGLNSTTLNTNDVLIKQKEMINIVNSEQKRLNEKKQSVDNALEGQQRLITLNNSYRLRYADYTKMIIIFTICSFFINIISITNIITFKKKIDNIIYIINIVFNI